jgi:hypothetical protein
MRLQLFERSVYGRQSIYPTGHLGPYVQRLTGKTTIDHRDLDALTELGIDIEWVKDPNNQHDK